MDEIRKTTGIYCSQYNPDFGVFPLVISHFTFFQTFQQRSADAKEEQQDLFH